MFILFAHVYLAYIYVSVPRAELTDRCVLGIEPGSSVRAVSVLNCQDISVGKLRCVLIKVEVHHDGIASGLGEIWETPC